MTIFFNKRRKNRTKICDKSVKTRVLLLDSKKYKKVKYLLSIIGKMY